MEDEQPCDWVDCTSPASTKAYASDGRPVCQQHQIADNIEHTTVQVKLTRDPVCWVAFATTGGTVSDWTHVASDDPVRALGLAAHRVIASMYAEQPEGSWENSEEGTSHEDAVSRWRRYFPDVPIKG